MLFADDMIMYEENLMSPQKTTRSNKFACKGYRTQISVNNCSKDINSLKIYLLTNCNSHQNLNKIFFLVREKFILKFIWRAKRKRKSKTVLKKKNEIRRMMLLNFMTYYTASMWLGRDRHIDQ